MTTIYELGEMKPTLPKNKRANRMEARGVTQESGGSAPLTGEEATDALTVRSSKLSRLARLGVSWLLPLRRRHLRRP